MSDNEISPEPVSEPPAQIDPTPEPPMSEPPDADFSLLDTEFKGMTDDQMEQMERRG